MALVLAIDPGPVTCGAVVWDGTRVVEARSETTVDHMLDTSMPWYAVGKHTRALLVAIERVQSYGIAGTDYLRTAEVVGRLWQRALDVGLRVVLVPRRDVLSYLDVSGRGNRDALVRARLIDRFGGPNGSRAVAVGTKRAPGALYGVAGHAWAALAVALTAEAQEVRRAAV